MRHFSSSSGGRANKSLEQTGAALRPSVEYWFSSGPGCSASSLGPNSEREAYYAHGVVLRFSGGHDTWDDHRSRIGLWPEAKMLRCLPASHLPEGHRVWHA